MSICLVALVVLAVMGIFSARYRRWAKEAFNCVGRRITLRPCNTSFNEKVKAVITSALMKRHIGIARFAHKHFEAISWVFTIVMILSIAQTALTGYNLLVYGSCDPLNPEGCPFTVDAPDMASCTSSASDCQPCDCSTNEMGCNEPDFSACGGDCECEEGMCGGS